MPEDCEVRQRDAGVPDDDIDVRRYGATRIVRATDRLQEAVGGVGALWLGHLEAATTDDHRKAFEWGRDEHVYNELKDAYDAFFTETRRAMGVLDEDPRYTAALDAVTARKS